MCNTGKGVVMYSGFCVLKEILEMRKGGVYAIGLVKNRHNWHRGIHRDSINKYCNTKILVMWDVLVVISMRNILAHLL